MVERVNSAYQVTIVIPVYNRSRMLDQALASLRNQTWKEFEVIISDDASTESLEKVVRRYPDLAITYHRFEENGGAHVNHQRGAVLCQTRYALFLNSDDLLFPRAVQAMYAAMEDDGKIAVCLGGILEFREEEASVSFREPRFPRIPDPSKRDWMQFNRIFGICPSQTMLRMSAFWEVGGFHPGCRAIYDWELFMALRHKYRIAVLSEVTTAYRTHAEQLTHEDDLDKGALNARDSLFVVSDKNPLRDRIGVGWFERMLFRQSIGWRLIRLSLRSSNPLVQLRFVARLLMQEKVLLGLIICAPAWMFLRVLSPSPKARSIAREEDEFYVRTLVAVEGKGTQSGQPAEDVSFQSDKFEP